jgi:3',5'-cyclic AMP phosphodiesterase CpdA
MLIAQLSDVHLRANEPLMYGRFEAPAALAAAVDHINRLDPRPDVVLATGDLTNDGLEDDYALLRRLLDRLAMPYYVIPGNHDDRDRLRATFRDKGYLPAEGAFLHYTVEDGDLRLIGLDTILPGEIGGGLCPERLRWLAERLEERPDRPTLIFMHHPPFATGIRFMDATGFEGADDLERLVRRHPQVRQIVCGHIHRPIHLTWAGTAAAVAPSTTFQMNLAFRPDEDFSPVADPPGIALYLWEDGTAGLIAHVSLIG